MKTQHKARSATCGTRAGIVPIVLVLLIGGAGAYVTPGQRPIATGVPVQNGFTQPSSPNVGSWPADYSGQQLAAWPDYTDAWTGSLGPGLRSVTSYDVQRWLTMYPNMPQSVGVRYRLPSASMPQYTALGVGQPAYMYQTPFGPGPIEVVWPRSASIPRAGWIQVPLAPASAPDDPCSGAYR